jgi:hypothetical protein
MVILLPKVLLWGSLPQNNGPRISQGSHHQLIIWQEAMLKI